jgi:large subunit ribosomal protein L25
MDQIVIEAQPRSVTGKKVKNLRRQGLVPLVVYGQAEPRNIQAVEFDTQRAIAHAGGQLMALTVEGADASLAVLAREVQRDAISGKLIHADLYEVDITEKLQVEVVLTLSGEAPLVETGEAMVRQVLNAVEIECLPTEIMQSIDVDISALVSFDDVIRVSDLSLPEGIEVLTPADELIVRLQGIQEEEEEEAEEVFAEVEAGEVEVIQRTRDEDEGEAE